MTTFEWIVCERSCRWAPALRTELTRQVRAPAATISLHEVRSLGELTARIKEQSKSLALIEVTPANLDEALAWLAEITRSCHYARTVALLDCTLAHGVDAAGGVDVASALREAGAVEIVQSPRHFQQVLLIGFRHAIRNDAHIARHRNLHARFMANADPGGCQSFEEWARALLPWQDARRPVG